MLTLTKVVAGIGSAGSNCYKDIYKAAKPCMTDRAMTVRSAAAKVSAAQACCIVGCVTMCVHVCVRPFLCTVLQRRFDPNARLTRSNTSTGVGGLCGFAAEEICNKSLAKRVWLGCCITVTAS